MCRSASPDSGVNKGFVVGRILGFIGFIRVSSAQVSIHFIEPVRSTVPGRDTVNKCTSDLLVAASRQSVVFDASRERLWVLQRIVKGSRPSGAPMAFLSSITSPCMLNVTGAY
jgi:hypothetical protein